MPRFDLDDKSIYSPIEFTINKKVYTVKNTSKKAIDMIADKPLCEQFSLLCGVELKIVEEEMSFFQIRKAMIMFYDALMRPIIAEAESLTALKGKSSKLTKKGKEAEVEKEKNESGDGIKE